MFDRLFRDHPADLGETYGEHFHEASGFGLAMIAGGVACLVHAFVPGVFKTRGSGTVAALHEQLVRKRGAKRDAHIDVRHGGWVI